MVNPLYVLALMASLAVLAHAEPVEPVDAAVPAGGQFYPRFNYCNLRSCNGPTHTLCKYPFLQPSSRCGRVTSASMTQDEIQEVLRAHENFRFVRMPLRWNRELAVIAQTWADQCITALDQCRNTPNQSVAQRYAFTKTAGPFRTRLSELVDVNSVPDGTTQVGCGAIRYSPEGSFNWTLLVCNYARGY